MNRTEALETIDHRRRRFIGAAAMTFAAAELGMSAPAKAASGSDRSGNGVRDPSGAEHRSARSSRSMPEC